MGDGEWLSDVQVMANESLKIYFVVSFCFMVDRKVGLMMALVMERCLMMFLYTELALMDDDCHW